MFRIVKHRKKGICAAHGCKKKSKKNDRFCSKHSHMYQKFKNPINYKYHQLKSRAKERNIEFGLTLEQFKIFCHRTKYMELKGKSKNSASIDRINPKIGYFYFNIQVLTLSNNVKKMHHDNSNTRYDDLPF